MDMEKKITVKEKEMSTKNKVVNVVLNIIGALLVGTFSALLFGNGVSVIMEKILK